MTIDTGACAAPGYWYAVCMMSSLTKSSKSTSILIECLRRNSMRAQTQSKQGYDRVQLYILEFRVWVKPNAV